MKRILLRAPRELHQLTLIPGGHFQIAVNEDGVFQTMMQDVIDPIILSMMDQARGVGKRVYNEWKRDSRI